MTAKDCPIPAKKHIITPPQNSHPDKMEEETDVRPLSSVLDLQKHLPEKPMESSQANEWKGLILRTFHWPSQQNTLKVPAAPAHSIIIGRSSSTVRAERRLEGGSWEEAVFDEAHHLAIRPAYRRAQWRWDTDVHVEHVNLRPKLLEATAQDVLDLDPTRITLIPRLGAHDPFIVEIIQALKTVLNTDCPRAESYADKLSETLAVHIVRNHCRVDQELPICSGGLPPVVLNRVTDHIQDHLDGNLKLEKLAALARLSKGHFARCFKEAVGEPPRKYVIERRIDESKRLLREGSLSVTQVSMQVGYGSQSHFAKKFKQHTGMTPSTYRQEH